MDSFFNAIKMHAGSLVQGQAQARFGTITSVNPNAVTACVSLQPEGVLTGWLPILSAWVGAGWGMVCLPSPGDQVLVLPQEGDAENGVIVACAFSNLQNPPVAPVGEFWLVHKTGSFIKLQNDGTIQINGDLHVAGDVYDRQGSLSRLRGHYDSHTHVDSKGGQTTSPSPQD